MLECWFDAADPKSVGQRESRGGEGERAAEERLTARLFGGGGGGREGERGRCK